MDLAGSIVNEVFQLLGPPVHIALDCLRKKLINQRFHCFQSLNKRLLVNHGSAPLMRKCRGLASHSVVRDVYGPRKTHRTPATFFLTKPASCSPARQSLASRSTSPRATLKWVSITSTIPSKVIPAGLPSIVTHTPAATPFRLYQHPSLISSSTAPCSS